MRFGTIQHYASSKKDSSECLILETAGLLAIDWVTSGGADHWGECHV